MRPPTPPVQRQAPGTQRGPRIVRDRDDLRIDLEGQGIEGLGALLDLLQGQRLGLEQAGAQIEAQLLPLGGRHHDVGAREVDVLRHSEQARQGDQAQIGQVDEVEDQAVPLALEQPGPASDALLVQRLAAGGAGHGDGGDLGIVEALGQHPHVGQGRVPAGPEVGQGPLAGLEGHQPVDHAGGHPHVVQGPRQVPRVAHVDAEHQGPPAPGQLEDRAGHQPVAGLDVDRVGQGVWIEVAGSGGQIGQIGRR